MHAVLDAVDRDRFMGRHKANHLQVAYAPDASGADAALAAKAVAFDRLGVAVHVVGTDLPSSRTAHCRASTSAPTRPRACWRHRRARSCSG